MKKILFTSILILFGFHIFAQETSKIKTLINEGVALHDSGNYEEAIKKYNEALELDKDNILALSEKAFSLFSSQNYNDCIDVCNKAIKTDPTSQDLKYVYTTYGNALDALKKPKKALKIYDEGLSLFPSYYHLHFNKGITLALSENYDDALYHFEKSISFNPNHASSHNAIARLSIMKDKRIPALMAFCRFFSLEHYSKRAEMNLPYVQNIMTANVEKTGESSVTINIDPALLSIDDNKENNFNSVDLILSMSSALDHDSKNKGKPEVELFIEKLDAVCSSLKELKSKNHGFYWEYYAPYFIKLKDENQIESLAYLTYATSNSENVKLWLDENQDQVASFLEWSNEFDWNLK